MSSVCYPFAQQARQLVNPGVPETRSVRSDFRAASLGRNSPTSHSGRRSSVCTTGTRSREEW
jgi:hypothetical protein